MDESNTQPLSIGTPTQIVQRSSFPPHLKYNVKYPASVGVA